MCIKLYNVFLLNQSVRVSLFCTNCTLHLCNTVIFLQTHFWLKNMGCRPHAHSFENTLHFTFFYNTVTQLCQSTKIWYSPPVKNSLLLLWGLNQADIHVVANHNYTSCHCGFRISYNYYNSYHSGTQAIK